ncbi:MAG: nucleoside phosphorylase [Candidatus Izemoplasmataceae bacterium]
MNIPILDTKGLDEEGLISPNIILEASKELPKHIDLAIMLFDPSPDEQILQECTPLFTFIGASYRLPQYIYKDKLVLSYAPLGSAAAGGLLEELIALGIKRVIACGSSGLIGDFDPKQFLLVSKAIRDEGLSYHYLEPSLYVDTSVSLNKMIKNALSKRNVLYDEGIAWTTDAFYRETKSRIALRKQQGAIAVEMECAGLCAVAKFRKIAFSQLLYFSDIVKQDGWSGFSEDRKSIKKQVNDLMLEIALELAE